MTSASEGKIGKYEIIRVLGRGGMGEVLLAEDRDLGRKVAIKRPFKSALEDGLARFQIEARAATLNHRNIPAVYELGVEDGLPFIAMEYVEGEPLDQILASGIPLSLISKLSIIEQVCSALEHAHQKGIIHRDIKPANVIVQPDGVIKIIDFGIAKIQSKDGNSGLTQTSQIIGSLHYIAPERFRGETIDGRADIFSTGVMLYLMLTGSLPFAGAEATAAYKIVHEKHTALSAHIHDYPPALDGILDCALAKNPAQRYASAEDFGDALHEVIDELKRNRVIQLFENAERLTTERRFEPALELLNEAMSLDPANTQVRKLRKLVREQQDKVKRAETLRNLLSSADQALSAERYVDSLSLLKQANDLEPVHPEVQEKIRFVEEKKRIYDRVMSALSSADSLKDRDINGAVKVLERALLEDPANIRLLTAFGTFHRQAQSEAQNAGLRELFETARSQLAMRNFAQVDELLAKAKALDQAHPEIDRLSIEMARLKEQDERRRILDEIQRRVYELVQGEKYDQAVELVNRAIDKLPSESTLHRLKAEIGEYIRQVESKRSVDDVISRARELSQVTPLDAMAVVDSAIEQMPNEERLLTYRRSLQQQVEASQADERYQDLIRNARQLMDEGHYEKAIDILEAYQLQYDSRPELDEFLVFAREGLANHQQRIAVERCMTETRSLMKEQRLEDAVLCLESTIKTNADPALSRLLEEVREDQHSSSRKVDLLLKRVALLRERGEVEEAIQLLRRQLAETPSNAQVASQLNALVTGQGQKQTISNAIASARQAAWQGHFSTGLDSLRAVQHGYGDTEELKSAIEELERARAIHAHEAVGRSIEMGRTALAKNDAPGAVAVLNSAASMLEFVDSQKQADWQQARQAAQDALPASTSFSPSHVGSAADASTSTALPIPTPPLTPTASATPGTIPLSPSGESKLPPPPPPPPPSIPPNSSMPPATEPGKSSSGLMLIVILICLLAAVVGGFAWWKMHPSPGRPGHLKIAKAPVGALVSIDHGAPRAVDSSGQFAVKLDPGDHLVEVSKDGFDPFSEKFTIAPGETINYPTVALARTPVTGTSGKLIPQGNVPDFRLLVDGQYRGMLHQGDQVALERGNHTVRYENADGSDFQEHSVVIASNQDLTDTFDLKSPRPGPGKTPSQNHSKAQIPNSETKSGDITPDKGKIESKTDSATQDFDQIKDAHDRFEAAYASKDIGRLKAEWLDIGSQRTAQMEDIFKRADIVMIHEKCNGQPSIKGEDAEWRCTEIVQLNKNYFGPSPKRLTFSKTGKKWTLKDK